MSFHKILDLGVPLVLLGIIALFVLIMGVLFLAILITCCCEKQRVRDFAPAAPDVLPTPSPYFQAMNDAASALGFQSGGLFGQARSSSTYRCCISLWLSPDRKSILCIGGGKLARMDYKRTMLISKISNSVSLVSMDAFGSEDLSGTRDVQVLMNADLIELKQFHLQRLVAARAEAKLFSDNNLFVEFEEWNRVRANRLVERGLARFLAPEHNDWRFNFKGAWRYATTAYFAGLKKAQAQKERANKKLPGS
jgi:hypothetical protein